MLHRSIHLRLFLLLLFLGGFNARAAVEISNTSAKRHYECMNHLENVLQVVSDKKLVAANQVAESDVVMQRDYYPFGSAIPNRSSGTHTPKHTQHTATIFRAKKAMKNGWKGPSPLNSGSTIRAPADS